MTCSYAVALQHTVHTSASGRGPLPCGMAIRDYSHITAKANVELVILAASIAKLYMYVTSQTPQCSLNRFGNFPRLSAHLCEENWGITQLKHMIKDLNESITIEI